MEGLMKRVFVKCVIAAVLLTGLSPDLQAANTASPSVEQHQDLLKARIQKLFFENLNVGKEMFLELLQNQGHVKDDDLFKLKMVDEGGIDASIWNELVKKIASGLGREEPPEERSISTLGELLEWFRDAKELSRDRGKVDAESTKKLGMVKRVFYATNRNFDYSSPGDESQFGAERKKDCEERTCLRFGEAEVSVPLGHRFGELEEAGRFDDKWDETKFFVVKEVRGFMEGQFHKTLSNALSKEEQLDGILVYVHGYNVDFGQALRRTAQISVDLAFKGEAIAFTWPSGGILNYTIDETDIEWSVPHLAYFLGKLRDNNKNTKIHLIGHSMGSRGLIGALAHLEKESGSKRLFDSLILAAPDYDSQAFKGIADKLAPLVTNWSVYASNKDFLLAFSAFKHNSHRLGQPIINLENIPMINASGVQVTPWNVAQTHSYFRTKKPVIDDVKAVIAGVPVDQRKNLEGVKVKGAKAGHWKFRDGLSPSESR